jgi:hypothetical protein
MIDPSYESMSLNIRQIELAREGWMIQGITIDRGITSMMQIHLLNYVGGHNYGQGKSHGEKQWHLPRMISCLLLTHLQQRY